MAQTYVTSQHFRTRNTGVFSARLAPRKTGVCDATYKGVATCTKKLYDVAACVPGFAAALVSLSLLMAAPQYAEAARSLPPSLKREDSSQIEEQMKAQIQLRQDSPSDAPSLAPTPPPVPEPKPEPRPSFLAPPSPTAPAPAPVPESKPYPAIMETKPVAPPQKESSTTAVVEDFEEEVKEANTVAIAVAGILLLLGASFYLNRPDPSAPRIVTVGPGEELKAKDWINNWKARQSGGGGGFIAVGQKWLASTQSSSGFSNNSSSPSAEGKPANVVDAQKWINDWKKRVKK